MNKVLLQQYRVAGDRRRAEQLETKMQAEYRDQLARRDAFDTELRDRLDRLQVRREQLQREYGIAIQQPERPGLSRQQHLTEAVKHMAEAGDHFEAVGMRRQALQLKHQLQDLERELRGDPLARPDPQELDTARLIDTLDRLNDRMERMERRLDDLRRP